MLSCIFQFLLIPFSFYVRPFIFLFLTCLQFSFLKYIDLWLLFIYRLSNFKKLNWIFFCEDVTEINLKNLQNVLQKYNSSQVSQIYSFKLNNSVSQIFLLLFHLKSFICQHFVNCNIYHP